MLGATLNNARVTPGSVFRNLTGFGDCVRGPHWLRVRQLNSLQTPVVTDILIQIARSLWNAGTTWRLVVKIDTKPIYAAFPPFVSGIDVA